MVNFAWRYHTLSFTCSLHFQWPWLYFKVIALSNSFNWSFYVFIRLSSNFVGLLSTLRRLWICHYFWLSHLFKGDNWHVSWFDKNFIVGFFIDTVSVRFFKLCINIYLASGLPIYTRFDDLDFISRSQVCQN